MAYSVMCAVCGKTATFDIEEGERAPEGWYYFGVVGTREFWECRECIDRTVEETSV
jgi:hypothetical protein